MADFEIDLDEENETVSATFNAGSLQVVNAISNGQDAPGKLVDQPGFLGDRQEALG